jgi:DNA-binding NarL/FixJ family response regulator
VTKSTGADNEGAARILIVDDAPGVRTLLRVVLPDLGFEIAAEAEDGGAGVEMAREEQPDVIILDLHLPDGNGIDALPLFRESSPDAKIIIYTSDDREELVKEAMAGGADGYVQKLGPVSDVGVEIKRILDLNGKT